MLYGIIALEWKRGPIPSVRPFYRGAHESEEDFLLRVLRSRWVGSTTLPIPISGEAKERLRRGLVAYITFPGERHLELVPLHCERKQWKQGVRVADFVVEEAKTDDTPFLFSEYDETKPSKPLRRSRDGSN